MALSHKLDLRHSQSLVMTPQLMQAIKLLQLSNLDLVAYVDAELERNPLLERGEGEEGGGDAPEEAAPNGDGHPEPGESDGDWLETRLETDASSTPTSAMSFPTTTAGLPPKRRRLCRAKAGRARRRAKR
jgi:RNA polymerase sigma-54 factor